MITASEQPRENSYTWKDIFFITSRLVGTHGVTIWSPPKDLSIQILDLIIESAIRESGDKRSSLEMSKNVSGYVCNHGSPSGERDTASPRGRYGERPQRDSVWRYICKNTTCWPATAHDVTTGVPQYKCRWENTSSASSSEACVRSMAQSLGDAVSRSPLGEPWLHT